MAGSMVKRLRHKARQLRTRLLSRTLCAKAPCFVKNLRSGGNADCLFIQDAECFPRSFSVKAQITTSLRNL